VSAVQIRPPLPTNQALSFTGFSFFALFLLSPQESVAIACAAVRDAQANSGKINMASAGNGSASHLAGELFKMMTGVDLVHVPYRGSFLPDLLGGQIQVVFPPIPTVIGYIRAGKLRALAVTSAARSEALPDIPTAVETVPGYEASAWYRQPQVVGNQRSLPLAS